MSYRRPDESHPSGTRYGSCLPASREARLARRYGRD
jgi:hypothetical protein